jgi:hypothetical protein
VLLNHAHDCPSSETVRQGLFSGFMKDFPNRIEDSTDERRDQVKGQGEELSAPF